MGSALRNRAVLVGLSLAVVLAAVPFSAYANEVGMEGIHCIDLPPDDFAVAVEQGFCGADGSDQWPGAGSGDGAVTGPCGTSSMFVVDKGNKRAEFIEGARSVKGPILFVKWDVPWVNQRTERQATISGNEQRVTTSPYWSNSDLVRTGRGNVTATLNGFVFTGKNVCWFYSPKDTTKITD